ncbi:hypothetical protein THASP1DRAFT_31995 [Thamnocephalis sphaerospora]|uniref:RRM domain-containing protein n=1 Tax=Thamnocephalis sphaerospora TaxID=78915 RepID=A0A4P9XK63_9FUNG|nr:hypothetical protein THASP1DRAFT_31995 [Thamnocephalis sphaerospora]|eukprot:RKP06188.1 hypothetical protein THASP1DRAFT_31995 [Thamnocephalis sphaerospora]
MSASPKQATPESKQVDSPATSIESASTSVAPAAPTPANTAASFLLDDDQRARLEKAKEFIRSVQLSLADKLSKKSALGALSVASPLASLSTPQSLQTVCANPALREFPRGIDTRIHMILSRIYVGSINFELTETHLRSAFSQFGVVRTVSMQMDAATGRHKGFCFVEFEVPEAAEMALSRMNGTELGGRALRCGRPSGFDGVADKMPEPPKDRIYIANVNNLVDEDMLKTIFEAFGKVKKFIDFESADVVTNAIASMDDFQLGGGNLRVGPAVMSGELADGMRILKDLGPMPIPQQSTPAILAPSVPGAGAASRSIGAAAAAAHETATLLAAKLHQDAHGSAVESVAAEENFSIRGSQRYAVMQKLAQREEATRTGSAKKTEIDVAPTTVVRIDNAVPASEADETLREDFEEECARFGRVLQVVIDADQDPAGETRVFVHFETEQSAQRAKEALHGRWFGGRQLRTLFYAVDAFAAGQYRL